MSDEFEDFEMQEEETDESSEVVRVKLPQGKELIGIIDKLLGNARMYVRCSDGKTRNGRVSGSNRRKLYIKPGAMVIVKPWDYEEDTKCDVIYKYTKTQSEWLRKHGYLKKLEEEF